MTVTPSSPPSSLSSPPMGTQPLPIGAPPAISVSHCRRVPHHEESRRERRCWWVQWEVANGCRRIWVGFGSTTAQELYRLSRDRPLSCRWPSPVRPPPSRVAARLCRGHRRRSLTVRDLGRAGARVDVVWQRDGGSLGRLRRGYPLPCCGPSPPRTPMPLILMVSFSGK
jgi:hypothetical protein